MWSLVDAVGGMRRRPGATVPDSSKAFDAEAVRKNDTLYDSARAYHAGQAVLLNVDTGRWVMLDPLQLCGVPRTEWTVDRHYVDALQRMHNELPRLEESVLPHVGVDEHEKARHAG